MNNIMELLTTSPNWIIAPGVLLGGWIVAIALRFVVTKALRVARFDQICDRSGICDFLRKGEVRFSPSQLVGRGAYWLILLCALFETARLLDIKALSELQQRMAAGLPSFLSGVMVLAIGIILVGFFAGFVRTLSRNAGSPYAELWARITRWAGTILVIAFAVEQADIRRSILAVTLQIVIAAFAFGVALAFGLGCRDMARAAMEKFIAYLKERHTNTSRADMEG